MAKMKVCGGNTHFYLTVNKAKMGLREKLENVDSPSYVKYCSDHGELDDCRSCVWLRAGHTHLKILLLDFL